MEYKSKPREGREHQLYTADGSRLVAGGIILDSTLEKVLMISSAKHKDKWIVPKGGIEEDEKEDFTLAARREVWEEAGVVVDENCMKKLPILNDCRKEIKHGDFPKCQFHFYQMKALKVEDVWPESDFRNRKWFSFTEASVELQKSKRPELLQSLINSDINRRCPFWC